MDDIIFEKYQNFVCAVDEYAYKIKTEASYI